MTGIRYFKNSLVEYIFIVNYDEMYFTWSTNDSNKVNLYEHHAYHPSNVQNNIDNGRLKDVTNSYSLKELLCFR